MFVYIILYALRANLDHKERCRSVDMIMIMMMLMTMMIIIVIIIVIIPFIHIQHSFCANIRRRLRGIVHVFMYIETKDNLSLVRIQKLLPGQNQIYRIVHAIRI